MFFFPYVFSFYLDLLLFSFFVVVFGCCVVVVIEAAMDGGDYDGSDGGDW